MFCQHCIASHRVASQSNLCLQQLIIVSTLYRSVAHGIFLQVCLPEQQADSHMQLPVATVMVANVKFKHSACLVQVFGITHDPFIVYSSNMFAILSLRALYGFVNTIMSELRYLDKAVALVLGFIGAKMLADFGGYHVPTTASLGVVVTTLAGGVAASLWLPAKAESK